MQQRYPKMWKWGKSRPLSEHVCAPDAIGFYELGFCEDGIFEPMYAGRAMGITLRQRLAQHCRHSHNLDVRKHSARLHFRCKVLPTQEVVAYVEAVSIAAMDYPWNRRNEWKQHWALET